METKNGIIKTILLKGKYGFIHQEDGSDLFFHKAGVLKPEFEDLREGMSAEFMVVESPKGKRAIGVVVK